MNNMGKNGKWAWLLSSCSLEHRGKKRRGNKYYEYHLRSTLLGVYVHPLARARATSERAATITRAMLLAIGLGLGVAPAVPEVGMTSAAVNPIIHVQPANLSLCTGSTQGGPAVLLFRSSADAKASELSDILRQVAHEVRRRKLRVAVCETRLSTDEMASASDAQHIDALPWREALAQSLGPSKAKQLRGILRTPKSRVVLLWKDRFDELTSGEGRFPVLHKRLTLHCKARSAPLRF